jgi:hypothetical protein
VSQHFIADAKLLTQKVLQRFPQSDDSLIIRTLVTQVGQDWYDASTVLEKLISLQGQATQAVTWGQWLRGMSCQMVDVRVMTVTTQGLADHPQEPQLLAEFNALQHIGVKPAHMDA